MRDPEIIMKRGDTAPSITFKCTPPPGVDLSSVSAVVFRFQPAGAADGVGVISGACTIISAAPSALVVRYDWGALDTVAAGDFEAEFQVTVAGKILTFPNDDPDDSFPYLAMRIWRDVA